MAELNLNNAQVKGLAGLFFDLANGLILGGIGFTVIGPLSGKISISILTFIVSFVLIQGALELLKGVEEWFPVIK